MDEHQCDQRGARGVHVHPHLSTVTYLSAHGAPTVVLDARSRASSPRAMARLHGPLSAGGRLSLRCV